MRGKRGSLTIIIIIIFLDKQGTTAAAAAAAAVRLSRVPVGTRLIASSSMNVPAPGWKVLFSISPIE